MSATSTTARRVRFDGRQCGASQKLVWLSRLFREVVDGLSHRHNSRETQPFPNEARRGPAPTCPSKPPSSARVAFDDCCTNDQAHCLHISSGVLGKHAAAFLKQVRPDHPQRFYFPTRRSIAPARLRSTWESRYAYTAQASNDRNFALNQALPGTIRDLNYVCRTSNSVCPFHISEQ